MKTLFTRIGNVLSTITFKRTVAALFAGILVMTTGVADASAAESNLSLAADVKAGLDRVTQQGETGRPRTTAQWQAENEALQGEPLKQLDRITEEAADAIGEMAEIYPQNAKTLTPGMDNGRLPKDD